MTVWPACDAPKSIALQARGVVAMVGAERVLRDCDLDLPTGSWSSVVGPNGAGKSTLLKVLAGLHPCQQGEVRVLGRTLAQWPERERARRVAWLGQGETAAADQCVADLVMLGRLPHQGWLALPSAHDHQAVEQALRATQAWPWRARRLGELSGGERQRVLLARALAVQADVLLMDEPLANLDPQHQADWLALVAGLTAAGTTVLSVLHEISLALQAPRMLIMADGRVVHQGAHDDPATHAALEAVFEQRLRIVQAEGQWMALPQRPPVRC